jgi:hypothetical protein
LTIVVETVIVIIKRSSIIELPTLQQHTAHKCAHPATSSARPSRLISSFITTTTIIIIASITTSTTNPPELLLNVA